MSRDGNLSLLLIENSRVGNSEWIVEVNLTAAGRGMWHWWSCTLDPPLMTGMINFSTVLYEMLTNTFPLNGWDAVDDITNLNKQALYYYFFLFLSLQFHPHSQRKKLLSVEIMDEVKTFPAKKKGVTKTTPSALAKISIVINSNMMTAISHYQHRDTGRKCSNSCVVRCDTSPFVSTIVLELVWSEGAALRLRNVCMTTSGLLLASSAHKWRATPPKNDESLATTSTAWKEDTSAHRRRICRFFPPSLGSLLLQI